VSTSTDHNNLVIFSRHELDLIAEFAGCSLDEKPGSNWVQDAGGLPDYICRIARAVKKTGKTTGSAISIAVSRVKKWATGVGVSTDVQAKAATAVAEWEKLKGKAHATKKGHTLAASHTDGPVLLLTDYNVDIVQQAFSDRARKARTDWRTAHPASSYDDTECPPYLWVKEQWTSFLIVQSDTGRNPELYKVPYQVDDNLDVTFGEPVEVKTQYVVVDSGELTGADLTDADLQQLLDLTPARSQSKADMFLALTPAPAAVDKLLALSQAAKKASAATPSS
jgi:hypothetical protein